MRNIFDIRNNFETFKHVKSHLVWGKRDDLISPEVSIIMPCYNNSKHFEEALQAAINQKFSKRYEILVLDNNPYCEGETVFQKIVEKLGSPKVLYYRHDENIGMFPNFNRGIELASAPYLTFAHDDDILLPEALDVLMKIQKKVGDKSIMQPSFCIDETGKLIGKYRQFEPIDKLCGLLTIGEVHRLPLEYYLKGNVGMGGGSLFSTKKLRELGGYDPYFYPSADYALHINYTKRYGSVMNNRMVYLYRKGDNNTSKKVYHTFIKYDVFFKRCMKPYLRYPKCFTDKIILAYYHKQNSDLKKEWEPELYSDSETYNASESERRIIHWESRYTGFMRFSLNNPFKKR